MHFLFVHNNPYQLERGARSQESVLISSFTHCKASNLKHKYAGCAKKQYFINTCPVQRLLACEWMTETSFCPQLRLNGIYTSV